MQKNSLFLHRYFLFAGPITEFGAEAQGFFNVFHKENKLWPDIAFVLNPLPVVSISESPC